MPQLVDYMRRRLAYISYTVVECYLEENWTQVEGWINIG